MSAEDNKALAREGYEAFNRGDFDRVVSLATDDIETVMYNAGQDTRGKEGFRQAVESWKIPFPDGEVKIVSQVATDDSVVSECVYEATHTRPLPMPDGSEVPPTGKRVSLPFIEVWKVRDGKCASLHLYGDNMDLMSQLGLMPEPQGAGA